MSDRATLLTVRQEFKDQPPILRSFLNSSVTIERAEENPILVGAGDSYAAALCASFIAGPKVSAFDPLSLLASAGWSRGRQVYIISISGQTKTNVQLASTLRGVASKTACITCNPASRLAAVVDEVVELPFRPTAKSPGIASFSLSLSAVLRICGVDPRCDFEGEISRAASLSKRVRVAAVRNVTHFVGNNEDYALGLYGAAKVYELLGGRAQASLLEEFSHMPLFSLSAGDRVNVLEAPGETRGGLLNKRLLKGRFASSLLRPQGAGVGRVFQLVFAVQLAAIEAAEREGLEAPYFLGASRKLRISDEMIY